MSVSVWLLCGLFGTMLQEPAASGDEAPAATAEAGEFQERTPRELDALLTWRTGDVLLGNGMAKLKLPSEFRYLDPPQAKRVLEDVWGNPPDDLTWGMVFPAEKGPFDPDGWGVVLRYEADGHVADDDASEIDYDEMLADMQKGAREESEERSKAGFGTLEIVGWAERPHYDPAHHRLFWAKEIDFGQGPSHTLNYDVRVLGRKGVLSMNAVADVTLLEEVRQGMATLLEAAEFGKGNRYEDFDSGTDKLAAYGIGGLIAGKLALKAGLFKGLVALLVAGKKLVIVALVGIAAFLRKLFGGKKAAQPAE